MINNTTLDVAIGLIFIFLLYSLLATTINELIATVFSNRSAMLERSIRQMLDGENIKPYWWVRLWDSLLRLSKKKNTVEAKVSSKKTVNALSKKFAAHPLYKRAASNSFLSRKPAYLSAVMFTDILVDLLSPQLDRPLLLSDISASVKNKFSDSELDINPETVTILNFYIFQANGDVIAFKSYLGKWFDDIQERVSGWYKKQSYFILFFIGIFLSVTFNISTIEIANKLSTDDVARNAMVKNASDYVQKNIVQPVSTSANGADNQKESDSIRLAKAQKALGDIQKIYTTSIQQSEQTLGLGWESEFKRDSIAWVKLVRAGKTKKSLTCFFISEAVSAKKIAGFFITALAISLGAPFWFDLLNRFINLRVSGKKPGEDGVAAAAGNADGKKPQPNSFA